MKRSPSNLWQPATIKFQGLYGCIKHHLTQELALVSKTGEIWAYNHNNCKAKVNIGKTRTARALYTLVHGIDMPTKEIDNKAEYVFYFSNDLLPEVVKVLKIKKNRISMARIANEKA